MGDTLSHHYWDINCSAGRVLSSFISMGERAKVGDVKSVWAEIAAVYYAPKRSASNGVTWWIDQNAVDKCVLVTKLTPLPPRELPGFAPPSSHAAEENLLIRCESGKKEFPTGWLGVIKSTIKTLHSRNEDYYVCIAVGKYFCLFFWLADDKSEESLWMDVGGEKCTFDPRLRLWFRGNTTELTPGNVMAINEDGKELEVALVTFRNSVCES